MQCHFTFADEDCTIPRHIQSYYTVTVLDVTITEYIERQYLYFAIFASRNGD